MLTLCVEGSGIRVDRPGQPSRSAAVFLLSVLLSCICTATPLQVYSESIQQLQLIAMEDPGLLSDAKSVWAAWERSLHFPVSSEKRLSLAEWGRIYTSKWHVKHIQANSTSQEESYLTSCDLWRMSNHSARPLFVYLPTTLKHAFRRKQWRGRQQGENKLWLCTLDPW